MALGRKASLGVPDRRVKAACEGWPRDELRGVRSGFLKGRCLSLLRRFVSQSHACWTGRGGARLGRAAEGREKEGIKKGRNKGTRGA